MWLFNKKINYYWLNNQFITKKIHDIFLLCTECTMHKTGFDYAKEHSGMPLLKGERTMNFRSMKRRLKQGISIAMAAAMVAGVVPQTALVASAEEMEESTEAVAGGQTEKESEEQSDISETS